MWTARSSTSKTAGPSGTRQTGCEVGFYINYEFKSFALGILMGAVFDKAFSKFAEAFEERANLVYSEKLPSASTDQVQRAAPLGDSAPSSNPSASSTARQPDGCAT